jgi:hypothetical protein
VSENSVVASVHIADVSAGRALRVFRRRPRPGVVAGLRTAEVAVATPLRSSGLPRPSLGRVALIAIWDDDASAVAFESNYPLAVEFADGWHARLQPLRMHGAWPGLPDEIPRARDVTSDEPAVVLTLGRLRLSHVRRFLRASRPAEASVLAAPGFVWGTALARPPFVATCSLWENARAITSYAYGSADPRHPDAIAEQHRKDFHKRSAFVRFRPYDVRGSLSKTNPLAERALAT